MAFTLIELLVVIIANPRILPPASAGKGENKGRLSAI